MRKKKGVRPGAMGIVRAPRKKYVPAGKTRVEMAHLAPRRNVGESAWAG